MATVSIFGIGYVGVVAAACLAKDGHHVIAVDIDPAKVAALNAGASPIVEPGLPALIAEGIDTGRLRATEDAEAAIEQSDISFVCVGTPSDENGAVGLAAVRDVCDTIGRALASKDRFHSVVIRSTIVPGTVSGVCIPVLEQRSGKRAGRDFGVGYYPEFLRESTAIRDYYDPGMIVYGALDARTASQLQALNADLPCSHHHVEIAAAEMVKYTSNAWRAVKISFANEIGNIAKSCGLDGPQIMDMLCSDTKVNISRAFMRPGFAFGGSCLPKDLRALSHLAAGHNVKTPLLHAALEANEAQIARAETMVMDSKAQHVGFVGISFKPGTDDLRESPLAELAQRLINKGVGVEIFDPYVQEALDGPQTAGRGSMGELQRRIVPNLAPLIDRSDAIVVGNYYHETVALLGKAARTKPMIDLARLDPALTSQGQYAGICW
ncbi:nucleotide sugar dehydrogenase [Cognatishimia sp. SS12]|uniref:nucleotide sugar dehydrogenase n=1 Tax=Cognatishimia sp. SS12 TaxID=2979465 RepID=UPI00232FEE1E|nr:nucleotide sugar dehydrogenase [Cognatishimia sp. SS12]MDC0738710.1 nucleotide sugar dehydrogenase [Cognatishimia sp. SS12]